MNYKLKYRLLLSLVFLFLIACYSFGIKKTIAQKVRYNENIKQSQVIDEAPQILKKYEAELQGIGSKISAYLGDWNKVDGVFFALLSDFAAKHKVEIDALEKPLEGSFEQYRLKTYPISLKGEYTSILAFVDDLEKDQSLGKPVSLDFHLEKDKNKNKVLQSTLYYKIVSSDEN